MATATLTSKGQITIPADVRRSLNVQTGDRVEFVEIQPGRFELVAADAFGARVEGHVREARAHAVDRGHESRDCRAGCQGGLRSGRSK